MKVCNQIVVYLIILCSFYGCSVEKHTNEDNKNFNIKRTLTGKAIKFKSNDRFLLNPVQGIFIDSLLLIKNDKSADQLFSIVDIKNEIVLRHFGNIGKGPDEFIPNHVGFIVKSKTPRSFEFYNSSSLKYIECNIDSILNGSPNAFKSIAEFRRSTESINSSNFSLPIQVRNINDDLFLTRDFYKAGRYGLCNSKGSLIGSFFPYPDNQENNYNPRLKVIVFQSAIRVHPKKNLFVTAFYFSDWVEICKVHNKKIKILHSGYSYLPEYAPSPMNKNLLKIDRNNKIGNFCISISENYLYVQRLGKTINEIMADNKILPSSANVFVYDWAGKPQIQYILDKEAESIVVDEEDQFLYAFANLPKPNIIKYKLRRLQ